MMRITTFFSFALLAIEPCFTAAQRLGTPSYEFLYTVNATLGERWPVGDYGQGSRVVIPITGGTFNGPRLSGTINNLGADWGLTDSKGVFFPDTRYNLRTHDGADIFIQTAGPTQPDGRTLLRGIFQTGHPDYEWLNYIVAIGVLQRPTGDHKGKYVLIDMWQVVLPCQGSDCQDQPQSGTVEQPMEPWTMQGV